MDRIGVADTMFARFDMGAEAVDELKSCPGYGDVSSCSAGPCRVSRISAWPVRR